MSDSPVVAGCRALAGGRPWAWPVASCRPGAAEVSGVQAGPQGRRAAMRSSLEAGGAAPYAARHPYGSERRRQPPPFCSGLSRCPVRRRRQPGTHPVPARGSSTRGSCGAGSSAGQRPRPGAPGCAPPGSCSWGSTGAAARWCSRCCPAATASAGRRSRCPECVRYFVRGIFSRPVPDVYPVLFLRAI